jgi:hypothetical protein
MYAISLKTFMAKAEYLPIKVYYVIIGRNRGKLKMAQVLQLVGLLHIVKAISKFHFTISWLMNYFQGITCSIYF